MRTSVPCIIPNHIKVTFVMSVLWMHVRVQEFGQLSSLSKVDMF